MRQSQEEWRQMGETQRKTQQKFDGDKSMAQTIPSAAEQKRVKGDT
ncbi:MAG TPA: hypothetical protein VGX03_03500 [Candidatus Binatia bacterium]|jgi:hypothetical protein|nr:hypothetical protein [Candidatus Binatia bacterium]